MWYSAHLSLIPSSVYTGRGDAHLESQHSSSDERKVILSYILSLGLAGTQ